MGRSPLGYVFDEYGNPRALTNAEKQRNYRDRLEEKQKKRAREAMTISTELLNALAKIRQLEYLVNLRQREDGDHEQLKEDFQRLKAENRRLRKEVNELKNRG